MDYSFSLARTYLHALFHNPEHDDDEEEHAAEQHRRLLKAKIEKKEGIVHTGESFKRKAGGQVGDMPVIIQAPKKVGMMMLASYCSLKISLLFSDLAVGAAIPLYIEVLGMNLGAPGSPSRRYFRRPRARPAAAGSCESARRRRIRTLAPTPCLLANAALRLVATPAARSPRSYPPLQPRHAFVKQHTIPPPHTSAGGGVLLLGRGRGWASGTGEIAGMCVARPHVRVPSAVAGHGAHHRTRPGSEGRHHVFRQELQPCLFG